MKIHFSDNEESPVAEIISDKIVISDVQDALDLMAECDYQGSRKIIINKKNIIPGFFNLSTGIAGEILQKFSTYKVQLAIVGDFSQYTGKNMRDFIYESNKTGKVIFVSTVEEAKEKLATRNQ